MVDGLTRFQAFLRMVVPDFGVGDPDGRDLHLHARDAGVRLRADVHFVRRRIQTVGVGVPIYLVRGDVYYWGSLMAACLIASLPIGFLYNLFLDRFIAGFTVGSVK